MIEPFEREARVMVWFFAVLLGFLLLATLLAPKIVRFWRVDSCLDHGGRYNYDADRCELEVE
jgi:hypothetical protein